MEKCTLKWHDRLNDRNRLLGINMRTVLLKETTVAIMGCIVFIKRLQSWTL